MELLPSTAVSIWAALLAITTVAVLAARDPYKLALIEELFLSPPRRLWRTIWWYRAVGSKLDAIFVLSQTDARSHRYALRYLVKRLIPLFGPTPPELASIPDSTGYRPIIRTPVELIWVLDGKRPMSVRFGMEMLDEHTGHPLSIEGFQVAAREIFAPENGEVTSSYDSTWPDLCYKVLLNHDWRADKSDVNKIQWFPGGEFSNGSVKPKFYYYPTRAAATSVSAFDVVGDCISRLGLSEQFAPVVDFFAENPHYGATPEFVGVEGVSPERNRFKVYVRIGADYSSLNEVVRVTSLDGALQHPNVKETTLAFTRLWRLLYPGRGDDEVVPSLRPGGRGMLIYFELGPGRQEVIPKVYVPCYRFEGTDEHVAGAITKYHRLYNQGGDVEKNYETHFRAIFAEYNLRQKHPSVHSYIGVATKSGTTQMTIYFTLDLFGVANS